jgi:hypothetical protein
VWSIPVDDAVATPRAQLELIAATERVTNWYAAMAQAVSGSGTVPRPLTADEAADGRLVASLGADLGSVAAADEQARAQTVRLVWSSDHVDAARRLQELVDEPARTAAGTSAGDLPPWLRRAAAPEGVSPGSATGTRATVRG